MKATATVVLTIALLIASTASSQPGAVINANVTLLETPPEVRRMQIALHITLNAMQEDWQLAYKNADTESELDLADSLLEGYDEARVVAVATAFETVANFFNANINSLFLDLMEIQLVERLIVDVTQTLAEQRDKTAQERGFETLMYVVLLLRDIL